MHAGFPAWFLQCLSIAFNTISPHVVNGTQPSPGFVGEGTAKIVSRALFQAIQVERLVTEKYCLLKLLFEGKFNQGSDLINWGALIHFSEPIEYFYQFANPNLTHYKYVPINARYLSNCWQTVIIMLKTELPNATKRIRHSHQDHHVFLSNSEIFLSQVMSSTHVLNIFSRKYGIFCEENSNTVGYIVDPPYYKGRMITVTSLQFSKVIDNYNGRTHIYKNLRTFMGTRQHTWMDCNTDLSWK